MTDARFADAYYEEAGPQAPRRAASAAIHERLRPLLENLGVDSRAIVTRTIDATRALAHSRLRAATQLGRADGAGKRLAITISDDVPPPIQPVLEQLPSELLWALIHRRTLALTREGVEHLLSDHYPPVAAFDDPTDFITRFMVLVVDAWFVTWPNLRRQRESVRYPLIEPLTDEVTEADALERPLHRRKQGH